MLLSGDLESGSFDETPPINKLDQRWSVTVTLIDETGRQQTDPIVISDKKKLSQKAILEDPSNKETLEGLQTTDPDRGQAQASGPTIIEMQDHNFAWPDLCPDHPYDIPFFASDFQGGRQGGKLLTAIWIDI